MRAWQYHTKIRQRKYKPLAVRSTDTKKPDGTKETLGIPAVKTDGYNKQSIRC